MTNKKIITETDALNDIFEWLNDRPVWQRDAMRRLVTNGGNLSTEDIDDLAALCKNSDLPHQPLAPTHVITHHVPSIIALKNLRDVENVNALARNQTLTFLPKGLTIIYGDNGAGKSGYVRVLKNACRARVIRGRTDNVLPNIYRMPNGSFQRAELEFYVDDQEQKTEWKNNETANPLLSRIRIFDSSTANVYIEETNDLHYMPYPIKLLERLVGACKLVKNKLEVEISEIKIQTPQSIVRPSCDPKTKVGQLINSLEKHTNPERVTALAILSEQELNRLTELNSYFSQESKLIIQRLLSQKTRLEILKDKLKALEEAISKKNLLRLKELTTDFFTKKEAAKLASEDISMKESLEGVGSKSWRKLWEAARAYSMVEAYSKQDFPVTDNEAHCVLCQQKLDPDGKIRLRRFEAFVQDRTQKEEEAARKALEDVKSTLCRASLSMSDLQNAKRFLADELGNRDIATAVRLFVIQTKWWIRKIIRSNTEIGLVLPELVDPHLQTIIDSMESRVQMLLADNESAERKELRAELVELKDRQWLSGIKDDVLAEITRRRLISDLETAIKDTRHNVITQKSTTLSAAIITDHLRGQFIQEIDHLNLAGLAIELEQASSQHGVSRFQIRLTHSRSNNVGDILSEGEYRCVALASFMAELATNNNGSGIIFDDPVSSLDHLHREAIAKRLADEGRKRQVIVFTHDLPFLFMLKNACHQVDNPALKTTLALRHIQKRGHEPGYCRNEGPEKTQDVISRLKAMRQHLSNCHIQYNKDPDSIDWLITARGLIDSLRQAWETAIEDVIAPVLRTFSSKINAKNFIKLSVITEADVFKMRQHYGQCSILLHKASDEINPVAPAPIIIEKELDALDSWIEDVIKRQNKLKVS